MSTRRSALALSALLLAGAAPAASASDAEYACRMILVGQSQSYDALLVGYAASPSGGPVGIHCVIRVNGMAVNSTPGSSSPQVQSVSFSATPEDDIDLCARVWDHGAGPTEHCYPLYTAQLSVPGVVDVQVW